MAKRTNGITTPSRDRANPEMVRDWYRDNEKTFAEFVLNGPKAEVPSYPINIFIEPINACNMACPFCATNYETRTRQLLPFDIFRKFVDEMREDKIFPRLTFAGEGEPFLHKETAEMVRYAKEAGFNVWTINNGSRFTRELTEQLINCRIDRVQFSIDSVIAEKFDKMRVAKGVRDSFFDEVMGNILHFSRRNYEEGSPCFVSISSVQTELNVGDAEAFKNFWYEMPFHNVFLAPLSTLQATAPSEEAKEKQYTGVMKDKPLCAVPFNSGKLNSNGDINICTHDYNGVYAAGNVRLQRFSEIWNGQNSLKLRQALLDGDVEDFVKIGHDCERCNNPLIGYGIDDYLKSTDERIERTVSVFNTPAPLKDGEDKYKKLLQRCKEFPVLA